MVIGWGEEDRWDVMGIKACGGRVDMIISCVVVVCVGVDVDVDVVDDSVVTCVFSLVIAHHDLLMFLQ